MSVSNLAVVYAAEGKYAEAEPLYRRTIAIDEKAKGPEDASVALDDSNLASLFETEGKYSEAEPLDIKALTIHMKVLEKSIRWLQRIWATWLCWPGRSEIYIC